MAYRIVRNNDHPELIFESDVSRDAFYTRIELLQKTPGLVIGRILEDVDAVWCDVIYRDRLFYLHHHDLMMDVLLLPGAGTTGTYEEFEALLRELGGEGRRAD